MMTRWIPIFIVLFLTACAGQNAGRDLLLSCHAYDRVLRYLTVYQTAGRLSESQIATVDHVRAVANPICMGDPPDLRTALTAINAELRRMVIIELEAKQ